MQQNDRRNKRIKVCAVIPAYNESKTIGKIIREATRCVDTVLVVDDGSIDNTAEIARQNGAEVIRYRVNRGMGAALQSGYSAAISRTFDIIVQLDGDGQHNPKYIPEMLAIIDDCDLVIGSRFLNHSHQEYSFVRRIGISFFTSIVNLLGRIKITDVTSGYRAFRIQSLKRMSHLSARHWAVGQTLEAGKKGLKIKEISVEMPLRGAGSSQFSLRTYALYPFRMVWIILKAMLLRRTAGGES